MSASLPGVCRWLGVVDMWVAEGHTPRWLWLWGCGCHLRIEGLCSMTTHPFCPMVIPIAHPIVVAFYPGWAIANFALLVWQGDTPDSGGAAIMGVPLPHLVLPLSGCLSRHTPTRAKRGEARGHRSVLAQNSLLMYPLLFSSFGFVVDMVCPCRLLD